MYREHFWFLYTLESIVVTLEDLLNVGNLMKVGFCVFFFFEIFPKHNKEGNDI
jgi:hypothetical protein